MSARSTSKSAADTLQWKYLVYQNRSNLDIFALPSRAPTRQNSTDDGSIQTAIRNEKKCSSKILDDEVATFGAGLPVFGVIGQWRSKRGKHF